MELYAHDRTHTIPLPLTRRYSAKSLAADIQLTFLGSLKHLSKLKHVSFSCFSRMYTIFDREDRENTSPWNSKSIEDIKQLTVDQIPQVGLNLLLQGSTPLSATLADDPFDPVRAEALAALGANVNAIVDNGMRIIAKCETIEALSWMLDRADVSFRADGLNFVESLLCEQDPITVAQFLTTIDIQTLKLAPFNKNSLLHVCGRLSAAVYMPRELSQPLLSDTWRSLLIHDIDAQDQHGNTLLHYSAQRSADSRFMQRLLELGADPMIRNNDGLTPLERLYSYRDTQIEKMDLLFHRCPEVKVPTDAVPNFLYLNHRVPVVSKFIQDSAPEEIERNLRMWDHPCFYMITRDLAEKGCLSVEQLDRVDILQQIIPHLQTDPLHATLVFLIKFGCSVSCTVFKSILRNLSNEQILELLPQMRFSSSWILETTFPSGSLFDPEEVSVDLLHQLCLKLVSTEMQHQLRVQLLLERGSAAAVLPTLLTRLFWEERNMDPEEYQSVKNSRLVVLRDVVDAVAASCCSSSGFSKAWGDLLSKYEKFATYASQHSIVLHMTNALKKHVS